MEVTDVNTIFASTTASVASILTTNIPLVLAIVAGLIGLSFMVRYVKKHLVGGR